MIQITSYRTDGSLLINSFYFIIIKGKWLFIEEYYEEQKNDR